MKDVQLHEILIANPHLIEEGCEFLDSEVNLNGKRCDLLFVDLDFTMDFSDILLNIKLKNKENKSFEIIELKMMLYFLENYDQVKVFTNRILFKQVFKRKSN